MDFEYITLTRKEFKRLKQLSCSPSGLPSKPNESGLINNRLITINRYGSHNPDAACLPAAISAITQEGRNYLLYRRQKRKDWFWNKGLQILNLLLALIAAVTGIIALLWR